MTQTALKSLALNQEGFFLLVEGSQIDWASHGNSIPGVISEMEDFMAAVSVALDFAKIDQQTLVVILADHETGGMAVGLDGTYRWDAEPLKGMKATPSGIIERMLGGDEALSAIVADSIAFKLSPGEIEMLDATERVEDEAFDAVAEIFNERTLTGWTSGGHTGVDVPLYAYGPGSAISAASCKTRTWAKCCAKYSCPNRSNNRQSRSRSCRVNGDSPRPYCDLSPNGLPVWAPCPAALRAPSPSIRLNGAGLTGTQYQALPDRIAHPCAPCDLHSIHGDKDSVRC